MAARLLIDLDKLRRNAVALADMCHANGISVAAVTKVFCADEKMVQVLAAAPIDYLADSRLANLARYPRKGPPGMLLRLPAPGDAVDTLRLCDISLNSEVKTLVQMETAAKKLGALHDVILMVDMGDLREGIHYTDTKQLYHCAEYVKECEMLRLAGFGLNLTCYGGVLPTRENLSRFCDIAMQVAQHYHVEEPIFSGGNSSSLYLLQRGEMPPAINNLRLGEVLVRGIETAWQQPVKGLETDVVCLDAEVIELQEKPSLPEGPSGKNAFGEIPAPVQDKGRRMRALQAVGRQDTDPDGLVCLTPGVEVLGASSDHLICDVTDAQSIPAVGKGCGFPFPTAPFCGDFPPTWWRGCTCKPAGGG